MYNGDNIKDGKNRNLHRICKYFLSMTVKTYSAFNIKYKITIGYIFVLFVCIELCAGDGPR